MEDFRVAIADALWKALSSTNLPSACERLGLAAGTVEEANSSKRAYVRARIIKYNANELMKLAEGVVAEYDVPNLEDFISERTTHSQHRVTEFTRRIVLGSLDDIEELFGDLPQDEGLAALGPDSTKNLWRGYGGFGEVLSNSELLLKCGALECSQQRFFNLIEKLVNPVCRTGDKQKNLAAKLNPLLAADGFGLAVVAELSRHPVYGVRRIAPGVNGAPKNLIFAATTSKPDLYFTDAINNDVAITNDSDALIYDRLLSESGLTWVSMVEWWKETRDVQDSGYAQKCLYTRLVASVKAARSPGEFVLFDTFYRHFAKTYGGNLPALIPQVYLHYDPKTAYQRGPNPVLARQRMDLLLLLDRNIRVVIEVDGRHHFATEDGQASPRQYATMAAEDRRLRLQGYEVYRFGAGEFPDTSMDGGKTKVGPRSEELAIEFFNQLFRKHSVAARSSSASSSTA